LGHPGSKPTLNSKAVELGTKIGLALNCKINQDFYFSRKTYFYPDMAMNYQITQYEIPLAQKGYLTMPNGTKIGITRAHLEWDPAALVHPQGMGNSSYVLIDYNRSCLPLVEIVTEPDLTSPKEAREFLNNLENILKYLHVLKPGFTLKVDSNVSINGGERVEIKNISGFAAVEKAISFEILRQKRDVTMGKKVELHTRAFNQDNNTTVELRKKESEDDYGYIFDPDLVKVSLKESEIDVVRESMPELPDTKAERFQKEFSINEYDSRVLCADLDLAVLFEEVSKESDPVISARLLTRELLAVLNHDSLKLKDVKVKKEDLSELINLIKEEKVSDTNVKRSMINYISGDKRSPKPYLEENNLLISESVDVGKIVEKIILLNEQAVKDYKSGNEKSFNFLVGLIMRESRGTLSPQKVQELVKEKLNSMSQDQEPSQNE